MKNIYSLMQIFLLTQCFILASCNNKKFKLIPEQEKVLILSERSIFDKSVLVEKSTLDDEIDLQVANGLIGVESIGSGNSQSGSIGSENIAGNSQSGSIGSENIAGNNQSGSIGSNITGNNQSGSINSISNGSTSNTSENNHNGNIDSVNTTENSQNETSHSADNASSTSGSSDANSVNNQNEYIDTDNSIGSSQNDNAKDNTKESFSDKSFPIDFLCSDARTKSNQGNLFESKEALTLEFRDYLDQPICSITSMNLRDIIMEKKRIPVPSHCPDLTKYPKKIKTLLFRTVKNTAKSNFIYLKKNLASEPYIESSYFKGNVKNRNSEIYVLLGTRTGKSAIQYEDKCDKKASPLFVQLGGSDSSLVLSSQNNGVSFDILGRNSYPFIGAKKKISWFQNESFLFLVKPNAKGEVNGIDQMFGNNTYGPDQKFSDDGFAALAKYDSNSDGVIDIEDPIFKQLRLWSDYNLNGKSDIGELFYLDYFGIKALELVYNKYFYERDMYDNEIRYKSLIQMEDGRINLMFDLWFKYQ